MPSKSVELRIDPYPGGCRLVDRLANARGWKVEADLVLTNGVYVVRELTVSPVDPDVVPAGGITQTGVLRRIPDLPSVLLDHRGKTGARTRDGQPLDVAAIATMFDGPAGKRALRSSRPGGRQGRPDSFYADWARQYVNELQSGNTNPVPAIAARGLYAEQTVRGFLQEARKRGLLTSPPAPGRAGGELTPAAIAALKEADR